MSDFWHKAGNIAYGIGIAAGEIAHGIGRIARVITGKAHFPHFHRPPMVPIAHGARDAWHSWFHAQRHMPHRLGPLPPHYQAMYDRFNQRAMGRRNPPPFRRDHNISPAPRGHHGNERS